MRSKPKALLGLIALAAMLGAFVPRRTCAQAGTTEPAKTVGSGASSRGSSGDAPSSALRQEAQQILKQMSQITGLPIRSQVHYRVVSHAEAQRDILRNLQSQYTPQEFHIQDAMLKAFGLVPANFRLRHFLISFYTEQAAGFYDPRTKTMYIARWIPDAMQPMVLSHELTHALQDQNFGLEKFLYAHRQNDDASAARQALVEGYATAAMLQRIIAPAQLGNFFSIRALLGPMLAGQIEQFPVFSKAPFFFRYESLFPYVAGAGFAQQVLRRGGWKQLNATFHDPPETTKDFFDPEAYFRKLSLPKVTLPQPKALQRLKNLSLLEENTLGELGVYVVVGQLISQAEARQVASGWLGDRYLLYENRQNGHTTLVGRTLWTSPSFAKEFFKDEEAMLKKKYPALQPRGKPRQDVFNATNADGRVMVLLRGREVLWAEGIPRHRGRAVLKFLRSLPSPTVTIAGSGARVRPSPGLGSKAGRSVRVK